VARTFRHQIDQGILDRAAALFARHGFTQTSVQAVADAVGMSKTGLLHYFPNKEALQDAVRERAQALQQEVIDQVGSLAVGAARDRLALETLVDQALATPGLVAFALSFVAAQDDDALTLTSHGINAKVLQAFGADDDTEPERIIRICGALAALSVLVLIAHHSGKSTAWRRHVIATSFDALGHPRPVSAG
jgi:AcrR family transcriptional regulator